MVLTACQAQLKKELVKTEVESWMQKTNLWLPGGKEGEGINWEFGIDVETLLYKIGN